MNRNAGDLTSVIPRQHGDAEKLDPTKSPSFPFEVRARSLRRFLSEHQRFVHLAARGHDSLDLINALDGSREDARLQNDVARERLCKRIGGLAAECLGPGSLFRRTDGIRVSFAPGWASDELDSKTCYGGAKS
jgi:hypothetical protein